MDPVTTDGKQVKKRSNQVASTHKEIRSKNLGTIRPKNHEENIFSKKSIPFKMNLLCSLLQAENQKNP